MTNQFLFQQPQFEFTRTSINAPQMMLIFLDEIFLRAQSQNYETEKIRHPAHNTGGGSGEVEIG